MNEGPTQDAPALGDPTDAEPTTDDTDDAPAIATEQTMDTPDELGGTGGEQAGGAG